MPIYNTGLGDRSAIYTYRLPGGERLRLRANLAEASAPIEYWGADEWVSTGYQTADALHEPREMLRLHLQSFGHDYYGTPDCMRGEACTCLADAVDGAREVE